MYDSFPICRSIFDHWIYDDADYLKVWITMLGRARYKKKPKTGLYQGIKYTLNYGEFIFGRPTWAKDLKIEDSKLKRLITKLVKNDMVELVNKYNKFTVYRIINYEKFNAKSDQQSDQQESIDIKGIKQDYDQQSDQQVTSTRPASDQQVTNNKERKNSKKDNKKNIYSENTALNESINDFIEMRKSIKKPISEKGITIMLNKLKKFSSNENVQIEILNQSIMNSWQGIFPLKDAVISITKEVEQPRKPREIKLV